MGAALQPGLRYQHQFLVPVSKTVPALYPEAEEFQVMPEVFATGFMVGFLEWACIKAIQPYLDQPHEQTVRTHINVSHQSPTPAGLTVIATVELIEINDRKLVFKVEAHDDIDLIATGTHERFVVLKDKFDAKVAAKKALLQQTNKA